MVFRETHGLCEHACRGFFEVDVGMLKRQSRDERVALYRDPQQKRIEVNHANQSNYRSDLQVSIFDNCLPVIFRSSPTLPF